MVCFLGAKHEVRRGNARLCKASSETESTSTFCRCCSMMGAEGVGDKYLCNACKKHKMNAFNALMEVENAYVNCA